MWSLFTRPYTHYTCKQIAPPRPVKYSHEYNCYTLLPVKNATPTPCHQHLFLMLFVFFVQTRENTEVHGAFFTHGYYIQLSNSFKWDVMTYLCIHELIFHKPFSYGACEPHSLLSSGDWRKRTAEN